MIQNDLKIVPKLEICRRYSGGTRGSQNGTKNDSKMVPKLEVVPRADFHEFVNPPIRNCYFCGFIASPEPPKSTHGISRGHWEEPQKHDVFTTCLKRSISVDFMLQIPCESSTVRRFSSVLLLFHLPARLRRPEKQPTESHEKRVKSLKNTMFFGRASKTLLKAIYKKKMNSRSTAPGGAY